MPMLAEKIGKLCKDKMIAELLLRFEKHPNFIITNYMGSSTSDMEALRRNLKKASANYFVVKNSVLKLVFGKIKLEEESSQVEGGIGISFAGGDVVSACNVLVGFAKTHDKFKIKGGVIEGKRTPADRIRRLASLPPKNVLIAQVVGGIKSPITGFVNVLGGVLRKFVYAIDAIKVSREKAKA
ncbi:MAG: 50S ribosomal protein L10 [Candidatus Omnitrophica bacterium]|nr:50S ribosomal protein L10 [Candidatus Omnitrophota bacterium]